MKLFCKINLVWFVHPFLIVNGQKQADITRFPTLYGEIKAILVETFEKNKKIPEINQRQV